MSRKQKALIWIAAAGISVVAIVRIEAWRAATRPVLLMGSVLRNDADPARQTPVANVTITAVGRSSSATAKSDSSGLFKLTVHSGLLPVLPLTLKFEHAEYHPQSVSAWSKDLLYVVRMQPLVQSSVPNHTENTAKAVQVKNARVRYSVKNQTTINVGSIAKQFVVANVGDVPCKGHHPCSPDGKWKAAFGTVSLDAQKGNEFRNVRVSCIAGPCPFTRLQPDDYSRPARKIDVTALNWSDTASFLVEAEVTRTMVTDKVLQAYPFNTGQTMSFALPGSAEGPSVVADLNGEEIVFPLGPALILSWAACSLEVAPGGNRIYRCELKPGYQFPQ